MMISVFYYLAFFFLSLFLVLYVFMTHFKLASCILGRLPPLTNLFSRQALLTSLLYSQCWCKAGEHSQATQWKVMG